MAAAAEEEEEARAVVPVAKGGARHAIARFGITRIHHTLLDGVSCAGICYAMHRYRSRLYVSALLLVTRARWWSASCFIRKGYIDMICVRP